jgi:hypothetical protein
MKKLAIIIIILFIFSVFPCYPEENDINTLPMDVSRFISEEHRAMIENYFLNEILNGIYYSRSYTKNEIINFYGEPLKNIVEETSSFYSDSFGLIAIRKLVYKDMMHVFYVFDNEVELHNRVVIDIPLERLITINIGDNKNKVKEVFGYIRLEHEDEITYRINYHGYTLDLRFLFENNIITKIEGVYFGVQ